MKKSKYSSPIRNLGITNIEDDIIRGSFKNYNKSMSTIVEENFKMSKPSNCNGEVFCGWFTARIYVGNQLLGRYKFDCTEYDVPRFIGNEDIHVTKLS